jgi:drug/metabolite transporter (DMT)-like permease
MFYPLFGSLLARKYLMERIPSKIKGGMLMICAGWALFYFPPVIQKSWGQHTWVGGILGLLTGIGWAMEGVAASGSSDLIDTDTCVAVRYLYEFAIWAALLLPLALFRPECLIWQFLINYKGRSLICPFDAPRDLTTPAFKTLFLQKERW